jgi:hypothetical protein
MLVFKALVDFDLNQQLVPLPFFIDGFLWDYFGCVQSAGLLVDGLVGLCETTSAEKFA